jgi:hypothetical protein
MMAGALQQQLLLSGAGAAFWSIPKAPTLGGLSGSICHLAVVDGSWPILKAAGHAASSRDGMDIAPVRRRGFMPMPLICHRFVGVPPLAISFVSARDFIRSRSAPAP